jgi:integrase
MRKSELLGLRVEDVDFERGVLRVRENEHRRVKTDGSERTVPLWPQLRSILRDHLWNREEPLEDLLFPSQTGGIITDLRKGLDAIGGAAGFEEGRIRTRLFRHTYTATRLQTLDGGAPVSPYTVSKELGHCSTRMVERVYAHLGNVRVRSEEVRYDPDEFEELEDLLWALREAS